MTEAKYVRRSLRTLSGELAELGHAAGPDTVADLLRDLGYRLRVNVKRLSGPYHPDRDQQFTFIEGLVAAFREEGLPILSVDTKKKELVGNFRNAGAAWRRSADEVNAHDFLSDAQCRAVPYAGTGLAPFCFSASGALVAATLLVLTGLGITVGLHRLLTHRSFATYPWVEPPGDAGGAGLPGRGHRLGGHPPPAPRPHGRRRRSPLTPG